VDEIVSTKERNPAAVEQQAKNLLSKAAGEDMEMGKLVELCKNATNELTELWKEEQAFEKEFKSMLGNGKLWADVDVGMCTDHETPQLKRKQTESMTKELRTFHLECDTNARKRSKIPKDAADELRNWFLEHQSNPYPTRKEKAELVKKTGLSATQVRNWFTNIRKRHWAPVRKGREPRSFLDVVVQRHMLVEQSQTPNQQSL